MCPSPSGRFGVRPISRIVSRIAGNAADELVPHLRAAGGQDDDAVVVVAEAELVLAAEHALALDAGDRALADRHVLRGEVRAERREHDEAARLRHVRRAAHELLLSGLPPSPAAVDRHQPQPALRRMRAHRDDARDEACVGSSAELGDAFDLETGRGEARGEILRRGRELGNELAKPVAGGLHRITIRTAPGSAGRCRTSA